MTRTDVLRGALVDQIMSWQPLPDAVAAAMRDVERHVFVLHVPLEEAYRDDTVITRRDEHGVATSSASAPWLVGLMLGQLQARPGMRVLEIGGGTGYNAALIAELVGRQGHVTAVEIAPDVAEDARKALAAAGFPSVEIICGDGEYGYEPNAPYDRIIATAGVWEIPDAWADQLTPDGILVVPLRMKGLTRAVAFRRDGRVWRSLSAHNCGFMPIRGHGQMPEHNVRVGGNLTVRFDDDRVVDAGALERVAAGPGVVEWAGVDIDEPLDLLEFFMADLDGFCRVLASASVTDRGLAEPLNGWGSMGLATADALGYLTKRTSPSNPYLWELGTCAYGPAAKKAVDELTARVRQWDRVRKSATGVIIQVYPAGQGDAAGALMSVDKRHSRLVVALAGKPDSSENCAETEPSR
ncbi:MAG: methyltransferase, FxLD system [Streptosporangiaceae bacterium]